MSHAKPYIYHFPQEMNAIGKWKYASPSSGLQLHLFLSSCLVYSDLTLFNLFWQGLGFNVLSEFSGLVLFTLPSPPPVLVKKNIKNWVPDIHPLHACWSSLMLSCRSGPLMPTGRMYQYVTLQFIFSFANKKETGEESVTLFFLEIIFFSFKTKKVTGRI